MNTHTTREEGALLIELLVAVVVLSVVAVGIGATLGGSARLETRNQAKNRLSATVETLAERLRSDGGWMQSTTCRATVDTGTTCDVTWMFDGTGAKPYNVPHPSLSHPDYGDVDLTATARAVDSADDGIGAADEDQVRYDYYAVRLEAEFVDAARFANGMKPVVLETTIDPATVTGTGGLALQVCRIRGQLDERMAIRECDEVRQEVMQPGPGWDEPTGGWGADEQAYTCAHPDHFRAPTARRFVQAPPAPKFVPEATVGAVNTKCFSADDQWAIPGSPPSYEPASDFFGTWRYDLFPDFSPHANTLPGDNPGTPYDDRYKYVSSVIEPMSGVTVEAKGIPATPTAGEREVLSTNSQGIARFTELVPGRYNITVTGAPGGLVRSQTMSVPGDSVTVSQGVESKATQVFRPAGGKSISISLRTVDTSFPWSPNRIGWRNLGAEATPPYVIGAWNPAWGSQYAGHGGTYTTHYGDTFTWDATANKAPGPWPQEPEYSNWIAFNRGPDDVPGTADDTPQPLCLTVRAAPWGRLVNGGRMVCNHGAPTTHYTFDDLQPGLYSFTIEGIPGFVWRRENNPGFLWIDEDGTTVPASNGAWSSRARATWYGCRDEARAMASFLFDPGLQTFFDPPFDAFHIPCGAIVNSSASDGGGGGTG